MNRDLNTPLQSTGSLTIGQPLLSYESLYRSCYNVDWFHDLHEESSVTFISAARVHDR